MIRFRSMGPWTIAAGAAIVLGALVILSGVPALVRAILAQRASTGVEQQNDAARLDAYRASYEAHIAQIAGRTMFYLPPEPPPPAPTRTMEDAAPAEVAPAAYTGPAIIAMINGDVWFDNGERLSIDDAAEHGLRVVSVNPPWGAVLEWNGKEFEVPLFDRTTPRFLEEPAESPEPTEPEASTAQSSPTPEPQP